MCSEASSTPRGTWKALGVHTHTREGKSQMPSQYHSRKSTWRALLGAPGAQGCSTGQAEAPGAQPQPLPCLGDSWEHPEQGCGHGALALTSRETQMCPGGRAAASVPLLAVPRFGSVSLRVRAELQAQPGEPAPASSFQGLFSCLQQFCPGAGGGILLSVWFCQSAPAKAVCALCQLPSCGGISSIRTSQTDTNPRLQHREERGCLSPAFSSGFSFWITLTPCLELASDCTCYPWAHLGRQCGAGAWPGWVCH